MLVAVNGTAVTVSVDGKRGLHLHVRRARIVDGQLVGLNKGLIGVGSHSAQGHVRQRRVQVLAPQSRST